jgi:DNA-binding NtrC family response regulator
MPLNSPAEHIPGFEYRATPMEYAAGDADALQRLRMRSFGVVITSPDSAVDEDLALLEEMRVIRPGVKCIVLAHHSTTGEVISALRARVFACFTPPFDPGRYREPGLSRGIRQSMARRYTSCIGQARLGLSPRKLPPHHC